VTLDERLTDEPGISGLERVVFFSDAVFAIAITLLAIDVRLPALAAHATNETVANGLAALMPAAFAFVLSFAVIAAFWIGHYRTFRVITKVDGRLLVLNLGFLFCIAALPFPTSVIAQQGDVPIAAAFYAAFGVLTGVMSIILWRYPVRAGLVAAMVTPEISRFVTYRVAVVPIMFAISIPIAFISPFLAWIWWVLISPVQALVTRRYPVRPAVGATPTADQPAMPPA
jgi:uncharacterized membrane protein